MTPRSREDVLRFMHILKKNIGKIKNTDVVIAPPFPYLSLIPKSSRYMLGAQDLFWESEGSYTGEVSAMMLKGLGVRFVIIGHSERRAYLHETDEEVNKKLKRALKTKLRPIVCVGELKRDVEGAFFGVVKKQIEAAFYKIKAAQASRVVIAYEPVWAISPGKPARPKDAREAALFIKKTIASLYGMKTAQKVLVVYGGSVDDTNAATFLKEREIAGLLVGRESRYAEKFLRILQCTKDIL